MATTRPSTRTVPTENGFFEVKIRGAVRLGKEAGPSRMGEHRRIPVRQEAHRGRRVGVRQRGVGQVDELSAGIVAVLRRA